MGGNQSVPKITKQDRAILESVHEWLAERSWDVIVHSLKLQRDKVRQYQKKVSTTSLLCARRRSHRGEQIQVVLNREHEIAKQQLASGNKDRALIALRKRKYQEGLLAKTDAQLENLENLVRYCVLPRSPISSTKCGIGLHH